MNAKELVWKLAEAGPEGLVMVLDEGGVIYSIKDVVVETHEDGMLSKTAWLKVEAY